MHQRLEEITKIPESTLDQSFLSTHLWVLASFYTNLSGPSLIHTMICSCLELQLW